MLRHFIKLIFDLWKSSFCFKIGSSANQIHIVLNCIGKSLVLGRILTETAQYKSYRTKTKCQMSLHILKTTLVCPECVRDMFLPQSDVMWFWPFWPTARGGNRNFPPGSADERRPTLRIFICSECSLQMEILKGIDKWSKISQILGNEATEMSFISIFKINIFTSGLF